MGAQLETKQKWKNGSCMKQCREQGPENPGKGIQGYYWLLLPYQEHRQKEDFLLSKNVQPNSNSRY